MSEYLPMSPPFNTPYHTLPCPPPSIGVQTESMQTSDGLQVDDHKIHSLSCMVGGVHLESIWSVWGSVKHTLCPSSVAVMEVKQAAEPREEGVAGGSWVETVRGWEWACPPTQWCANRTKQGNGFDSLQRGGRL